MNRLDKLKQRVDPDGIKDKCYKCGGSGKQPNAPGIGCRYCGGTGKPNYVPAKKIKDESVTPNDRKKYPYHTDKAIEGIKLIESLTDDMLKDIHEKEYDSNYLKAILKRMGRETNPTWILGAARKEMVDRGLLDSVGPSEGYGALDMSKDKKQAFKGARWTVKFNENKITKSELSGLIKEMVSEMWADTGPGVTMGDMDGMGDIGGGDEEDGVKTTGRLVEPGADAPFVDLYKNGGTGKSSSLPSVGGGMSEVSDEFMTPGWQPKMFIKNQKEVANLIFQLKEGEIISFMFLKSGRSRYWEAVAKKSEGDNYNYYYFTPKNEKDWTPLPTDEEVWDVAKQIAENPYLKYYVVTPDVNYKKQITELYEDRNMITKDTLKEIIREVVEEALGSQSPLAGKNPNAPQEYEDREEKREVEIAKEIVRLTGYGELDINKTQKVRELAQELIKMHGQQPMS